jgi:hypothetical protein
MFTCLVGEADERKRISQDAARDDVVGSQEVNHPHIYAGDAADCELLAEL